MSSRRAGGSFSTGHAGLPSWTGLCIKIKEIVIGLKIDDITLGSPSHHGCAPKALPDDGEQHPVCQWRFMGCWRGRLNAPVPSKTPTGQHRLSPR
jgi:hypothetical protein